MELDFEDIHFIVEKSMEAAQLATVLALEPAGSLLLESEIKRWLKYNISKGGTDNNRTYRKFLELVDRGVIQGKRHGKAKTSHVYYNKGEIKKAFAEVESCSGWLKRKEEDDERRFYMHQPRHTGTLGMEKSCILQALGRIDYDGQL